jgi:hypothetical protein
MFLGKTEHLGFGPDPLTEATLINLSPQLVRVPRHG